MSKAINQTNLKPGCISKGIRHLKKPQHVTINIDGNSKKPSLVVIHANGDTDCLPISKKVAEVLIARGMAYGG